MTIWQRTHSTWLLWLLKMKQSSASSSALTLPFHPRNVLRRLMIVLKSEIVPVPSPPTLLSMMMFSNKMIFSNKSLVTLKVCTIQIGIKANERLISVWHTSEVESDATLTDVDWRSSTLSEFVWTCLKHAIGQGLDRRWRNDRLFLNGLSDSNYKSILGFCHKRCYSGAKSRLF